MNVTKTLWIGVLTAALLPAVAVAESPGWGYLAQAFMVSRVLDGGSLAGYYGAAAVNVFEATANGRCRPQLYDLTHRQYQLLWDARTSAPISIDFGLGFATQNVIWGTNSTALTESITGGLGKGYLVAKAELLAQDLPLADFGIDLPDAQAAELYMAFVSLAVEKRVARSRGYLGAVLYRAAKRRSDRFPSMLVDAYAPAVASNCGLDQGLATNFIEDQERAFRNALRSYGSTILRGGRGAFRMIVARWADLTSATWKNADRTPVGARRLRQLARIYLPVAEELVRDDCMAELRATAKRVAGEMFQKLPTDATDGGIDDDGSTDTTDTTETTDTTGTVE